MLILFLLFSPRSNRDADWETCVSVPDFDWKQIAEPVMKLYTETTDGSAIETKESALVWNYLYADPDFGFCQAKELLDHLESVLANEPVSVKSGQHIVEVKPQVSSTHSIGYQSPSIFLCRHIISITTLHFLINRRKPNRVNYLTGIKKKNNLLYFSLK